MFFGNKKPKTGQPARQPAPDGCRPEIVQGLYLRIPALFPVDHGRSPGTLTKAALLSRISDIKVQGSSDAAKPSLREAEEALTMAIEKGFIALGYGVASRNQLLKGGGDKGDTYSLTKSGIDQALLQRTT
jgi:hypothetical protein